MMNFLTNFAPIYAETYRFSGDSAPLNMHRCEFDY